MDSNVRGSLVLVYTSPSAFEADVVKAMLADENISSSVENENGPFPGLNATPCKVYVTSEHEAVAKKLIAVHETQYRNRLAEGLESESDWNDESTENFDGCEADTAEYEVIDDE